MDSVAVEHTAAMRGLTPTAVAASALLLAVCGGARSDSPVTYPVFLLSSVGSMAEAKDVAMRLSTPIMIHAENAYALSPQCLPERLFATLEDSRAFAALEDSRQFGSGQDERAFGSSQDERHIVSAQDQRQIENSQDGREFSGDQDARRFGGDQDGRGFGGDADWRHFGSMADYRDFGAQESRLRCSLDPTGTTARLHGGQNAPAFLLDPNGITVIRMTHSRKNSP